MASAINITLGVPGRRAAKFKHAATRQPRRKPTVETCVDTTASYGRRHRSWHYEPQAKTNC